MITSRFIVDVYSLFLFCGFTWSSSCSCSFWRNSEETQPHLSVDSSAPSSSCWSWKPGVSVWSRRRPLGWSCSVFLLWTCWTSWPTCLSSCSSTSPSSPTLWTTPARPDLSRLDCRATTTLKVAVVDTGLKPVFITCLVLLCETQLEKTMGWKRRLYTERPEIKLANYDLVAVRQADQPHFPSCAPVFFYII